MCQTIPGEESLKGNDNFSEYRKKHYVFCLFSPYLRLIPPFIPFPRDVTLLGNGTRKNSEFRPTPEQENRTTEIYVGLRK